MKIFLTGACGNIGSAIRRVGAKEHEFVLVDVVSEVQKLGGHQVNITDRDAIMRLTAGCDAIVHTAAMHGGWFGKEPNAAFIETNVLSSEYLFQAALEHGIKRLVMSSSMEVLIGRQWDASGVAVVDEMSTWQPDWIYPVTKVMVEQLGSYYAQHHGLEVVHLRYSSVPPIPWQGHALGLLTRQIASDDAGRANLLATTVNGIKDEVFCIAPKSPLTLTDSLQAVNDSPEPVLERYWPGVVDFLKEKEIPIHADRFWPLTRIDKAKTYLGWEPQITFDTWLTHHGWTGSIQDHSGVKER